MHLLLTNKISQISGKSPPETEYEKNSEEVSDFESLLSKSETFSLILLAFQLIFLKNGDDYFTKKCIDENSTTAQDQDKYAERYNGYVERYEKAKARYGELAALRKEKQTRVGTIDWFIAELRKRDELFTVFDNRLWLTVVDFAEVRRDGTLTFHFCDGTSLMK